jgi:glycosyltransferase involved in cell wall biosynthesis
MKVALIYSFKESDWFSCTVINKNLRKAYSELYGEENLVHINYSRNRQVLISDLRVISEEKIEKLIFIDHKPTPIEFLKELNKIEEEGPTNREYIIHVFGDYPLYLTEWRSVNELLLGKKVKYICASLKQKKYIEKYITPAEIVYVSPFPVDSKQFNVNSEKRTSLRSELGVAIEDKVMVYTGRLSYQKRISELVDLFLGLIRDGKIEKNNKLLIIGKYDLLGLQYLSYTQINGEYFRTIDKVLAKYPGLEDQVIFHGEVDNAQLNDYYNLADFYVSLSTYHDEDYGMSVAEALCSGLPALLTNWAGYFSFQLHDKKEFCSLVPVELGKYKPTIDLEVAQTNMIKLLNMDYNREEVAKLYQNNFSVKACAKKLGEIVNAKSILYDGPTELMIQLTNEQFLKGNEIFRLETNREFNSFYFKAYDVYAE